jgi:glycosyltransferase involved in cell wall biosynthesis
VNLPPEFPPLAPPEYELREENLPEGFSVKIFKEPFAFKEDEYPLVSIIIPTLNCAHSIGQTLDNLLNQDYPLLEVIVIDAGSTDRTIEVIKSYRHHAVKIFSVSGYFRYEMLNKGISHANGLYFNFLFPGDFYISRSTLKYMMGLALKHDSPSLVFCGTLIRDGKTEPKILFRHLSLKILKRGQQPTSLQSCWFKRDVFQKIGKFDTSYSLRGGFELFCRFVTRGGFQTVATPHILTDYDLHLVTRNMVFTHFWETFRTIWKYFGLFHLFAWLASQKDFSRYANLWMRSAKSAFMSKYG